MPEIDLTSEIHSTNPEFEQLLQGAAVPATEFMLGLLDELGLPAIRQGNTLKLADAIEPLQPTLIREVTGSGRQSNNTFSLAIHRVIGSTNDDVMARLDSRTTGTLISMAEMQTAGKGRRGRKWVSPFGRNIYLTIGRNLQIPAARLGGLSIVIGITAARVLQDSGTLDVRLKWPNDLILGSGKLGGILVELQSPGTGSVGVVAGIGINLQLRAQEVSAIDQPWSQAGQEMSRTRNYLAGSLIRELMQALTVFSAKGFEPWREKWPGFNINQDKLVQISKGDEFIKGIDRGVDESGNLRLECDSGIVLFNSGEVSLRSAQ